MIRKLVKKLAIKNYKYKNLYLKFYRPSPTEYAEYLKHHRVFHSMGDNCYVLPSCNFTDPDYVRMGDNVMLSACNLIGHDGSIRMLNIAFDKKLDKVGFIDIGDNVFIGHGAMILPNVRIGSNIVIGAGSLVTKDIPDGVIVGGVPAKVIGNTRDYVSKLEVNTKAMPWYSLIASRKGAFDETIEAALVEMRVKYFFGDEK